MTFDLRLAVVAFSTSAFAIVAGSLVTSLASKDRPSDSPARDARTLFRLRLLPVALAAIATGQAMLSFAVFEPRSEYESVGIVLSVLAVIGVSFYAVSLGRWARVSRATRRAIREWMRTATPVDLPGALIPCYAIESDFPVVAVAGIRRPRLLVARQVLSACSPAELRAVLAHESRHIANRDNLRRAVMMCLPDPFGASNPLMTRWHEATEEAADDAAGEPDHEGRYHLAAALLNVARLVPAGQPAVFLPTSALYRGEDLARRVRRLVDSEAPPPLRRASMTSWLPVVAMFFAVCGLALPLVHQLVEAAVTYLP